MSSFQRILLGIGPISLVFSTVGLAQQRTMPVSQSAQPAPRLRVPDEHDARVQAVRGAHPSRSELAPTTMPASDLPVALSARPHLDSASESCHHDCHQHRGLLGRIKRWWNHRRTRGGQNGCTGCNTSAEAPEQLPLGYVVNEHVSTQISNGEAARMVLYRYDFIDATAQLKPRGRRRLAEIAQSLPSSFHPVIVQQTIVRPTGEPEVDEEVQRAADELDRMRRDAVLAALREMTIPVPEERVRIGPPIVPGLRADEGQATEVYDRLLVPSDGGPGSGASQSPATGSVGIP